MKVVVVLLIVFAFLKGTQARNIPAQEENDSFMARNIPTQEENDSPKARNIPTQEENDSFKARNIPTQEENDSSKPLNTTELKDSTQPQNMSSGNNWIWFMIAFIVFIVLLVCLYCCLSVVGRGCGDSNDALFFMAVVTLCFGLCNPR